MTRRLNWEKANLAGKPKVSIADEMEFSAKSRTARWLEKAERRAAERKRSKPELSHAKR